jgi:chromatin remodeling complex protein RSC6
MPAKKQTSKKQSAKETKKTTPVPTPVPVVETVVTPVETTVESGNNVQQAPDLFNYSDEFTLLKSQLNDALSLVKSLTTAVTALERRCARDKKVVDKKMKGKAKKPRDPNAPPTGFQKPINVSAELKKFLALTEGELIARTQVTSRINDYCKKHGLQKQEDKRILMPDATLTKLLRLKKGDELTFFNLQKHLKHHYPNKEGVFEHA